MCERCERLRAGYLGQEAICSFVIRIDDPPMTELDAFQGGT